MVEKSVKTIFFGSSVFAREVLRSLITCSQIQLIAIVTQPDRKAGRNQEMKELEVKRFAKAHLSDIEIFQPEKLSREAQTILEKKPDLIIVADYGQMIPESIINYPRYKCLNVHGSYLPELRGAVPIQMTILQGKEYAGISIPIMTKGLDDGPIIVQRKFTLSTSETTQSLTLRLGNEGGKLLAQILPEWIAGTVTPTHQDDKKVTHCYQSDIAKEQAFITWTEGVNQIDRMIRAFNPWPVAWTHIELNGQKKRLRIFSAIKIDIKDLHKPGILYVKDNRLFINCIDGTLELREIQLESKKKLPASFYHYLAND